MRPSNIRRHSPPCLCMARSRFPWSPPERNNKDSDGNLPLLVLHMQYGSRDATAQRSLAVPCSNRFNRPKANEPERRPFLSRITYLCRMLFCPNWPITIPWPSIPKSVNYLYLDLSTGPRRIGKVLSGSPHKCQWHSHCHMAHS